MRTKQTKISIAIPNYNKGKYLDTLLQSIQKQNILNFSDNLEIVVCDNASSDITDSVIENFLYNSNLDLKYIKNSENIGFQKNLMRAIKNTEGDYVWLMGSDDALKEDSLSSILDEISDNEKIDIYLLNRTLCNKNLEPYRDDNYLPFINNYEGNISKESIFIEYLNNSLTVNALGCFISSLVIKRNIINELINLSERDHFFLDNIFPHVYLILNLIISKNRLILKYISEPKVFWRGENSSFMEGEAHKFNDLISIVSKITQRGKISFNLKKLIIKHYKKDITIGALLNQKVSKDMFSKTISNKYQNDHYLKPQLKEKYCKIIYEFSFIYYKTIWLKKLLMIVKKRINSLMIGT